MAAAAMLADAGHYSGVPVEAQGSPCGPTINPIACENQKVGAPASEWDISGAGDASIQGFATDISVDQGQTVRFKIASGGTYQIEIYRLGYYGGMGARKIATIPTPPATLPARTQPNCLANTGTGLIDCGNWTEAASWTVPVDATSGIYIAKLTRTDTGGASHVIFIVRDDDGRSDLLFQASDTTWQAYNSYGGNSLYVGSASDPPASRAYKVSYNRPFNTRQASPEDWVFNAEYPMVRWLEANGYDVSYSTGVDSDRRGAEILDHKVFLSVGHDEYWSGGQRANVEAARNHPTTPVHLAFFSGNEVFWKTRWEPSIDGSITPYRTLVSYKETHANAVIDPADPPIWTGTWRDPRFSPFADGGRPENALTGTSFRANCCTGGIAVPAAYGKLRFWRNTTVATLPPGGVATMPNGTLGYEWDEAPNDSFSPPGLMRLSSTTLSVPQMLLDYGSSYGAGTVTHSLTLYRHSSSALVFGAGTVQWSWGLDSNHDRGSALPDVRMQQATVNLLADMGAQPTTLQAGLSAASSSLDTTPPASSISSPTAGASFSAGTPITISGTASDSGGGIVAGVEVSVDGGTTWSQANGTTSWTYQWTAAGSGAVTINSRAFDDSGNPQISPAAVTINVTTPPCPCSIWSASAVPPAPLDDGDTSAVEIGTKFRADVNGYITGVRFYKGNLNTGTHVGKLWTGTGTLLGSVTFTNETSSGWQQASFSSAIPITANTTYVVSYHAPNGHYTGTDRYFETSGVDNPPLHALKDGVEGPNGVYQYGPSAFPTQTYLSEAYWVDVTFVTTPPPDTTPPTVTSVFPASGSGGVDPATAVVATFSEAMDPATISSSTTGGEGGSSSLGTFELRDPAANLVTATVSYDSTTKTATLRPSSSLALSTTYTALIKGGGTDPRVKDLAGNAMAANVTWSFTTAAAPPPPFVCPCSIWPASAVPQKIDDGDTNSVEIGTKFRSDVAGHVTGARFYKSSLNTGTHVAKLWTNAGTLLGSATFVSESATGWQQVAFASPIQISANTTYVISYHANNGHYSSSSQYFATSGVDSPPLHALRDGADGPNGVYRYGTSAFPIQTFNSEAYWIDIVFNTTAGPDTTPPVVSLVSPAPGMSGVNTNVSVTAAFNESMNATTVTGTTFLLRDPSNVIVPAAVTYTAGTMTATLVPSAPLAYSTTYTAVIKGGGVDPRVKDLAGNAMATDYAWSFATAAPPPPPPTQGPGGPVLVVTRTSNPFTSYYAEILRNEGFNAFATLDLSQVTSTTLSAHDVVLLGEMSLTPAQVSMFSDWVTAGGNLIAMRPDKQLAGLLGLTDAAATLSNAYVLVNTVSGPGTGIVNQTMQSHGTADRYTLNGAAALATLYSDATTATTNPAVTLRNVGPNGGHAVAFTYDLARSVVYTRQGNPAWSGQERDGQAPIRSDDLYYGARPGDVQPDWVDLNKVAIPQADEQQRFLWNIILNVNATKKPLPRFWYFPRMSKAVVIMTGDDHASGGTAGRFDQYIASSPAGCSISDWECIRSTSYIYPASPLTNAQAIAYVGQGFEVALHVNTQCADWTASTLASFYADQLTQFASNYPDVPASKTNRTHCIAWSDYATQPQVEANNGIRLDTTYYYWPSTWIQNRPGLFTGSGMPMRFASLSGQLIDVYQATTQMTDESGQTYPSTIDALLTRALGPEGYYGAFAANMHTDQEFSAGSDAIIASTRANGVPVISAKQMLEWLDGRNGSSFQAMIWGGNVLSFDIAVGVGANGLRAMVPTLSAGGALTAVERNGSAISYTLETIKGIEYAIFSAAAGSYRAVYGADTTAPVISAVTSAPGVDTATVTWSTNEASTSRVDYGTSPSSLTSNVTNPALVTTHSLPVSGLTPNTTYYYRVTSVDAANNIATSPVMAQAPLSFTTLPPSVSIGDTSVTEGNTGTVNAIFSVTLSAASAQAVTVNYATADGTSTAGSDYVATAGTLTFAAGTTSQPITVTVNGDTVTEPTETFTVTLSNPTNAVTGKAQGTGTITNDDNAGLVAAYGFNESSGTTAIDASGNGLHGTVSGATSTAAGRYGRALTFDGVNDWVTVNDAAALDLTTRMTLEAWVRPAALSGWRTAILKQVTGGLAYALYAHDDAPRPATYVNTGGSDLAAIGTSQLPLNTWTHLAATYDGATLRMFVNGAQVGSRAVTGSIRTSASALRIGGNSVWGEYFAGDIDEIRIYNRALTQAEIQADMNTAVP